MKLLEGDMIMESFDINKLMTAITYLDRIADGKNPVNNQPAPDDAVLNDPNVIRCMFFVKEILESVKRNGGVIGRRNTPPKLDFPVEVLKEFEYRGDKPITKVVEQINEKVDGDIYKKLTYKVITDWLKANEYLVEQYSEKYQKKVTMPTDKGKGIGIISEERVSSRGDGYIAIIYTKQAQEFIVNNMGFIIDGEVM